jgi:hypothetical protein
MNTNKLIIAFKQLPKSIKLTTYLYTGCLLGYNIMGTYIDAKKSLIIYREIEKIDKNVKIEKTEWDAVKYGARLRAVERLWDSLI